MNNLLLSVKNGVYYKYDKDSLHQLLLRILELEDTYVDTPTLVNKLRKMNV